MQTAIDIHDFSLRLGKNEILHNLSLSVAQGQYVAIVGPNGAGKSTLLKSFIRIHSSYRGRIEIFSKPLEDYRQWELARRISYVPQGGGTRSPFTVKQFILMARYPHWSPFVGVGPTDRRLVGEFLEKTGTIDLVERRLATLSGGELQKVYVTAALVQEADVVLLDEPTAFLDYHHQLEIRQLLAAANRELGTTIVSVTHDLNDAAMQSDRVIAMRDGTIVFNGSPTKLMNPETLSHIYDTSFVMVNHPQSGTPVIMPPTILDRNR